MSAAATRIRARGLVWDILSRQPVGRQTCLRLRCASGDLAGLEWTLLTPWETMAPADTALRPTSPAGLDAWRVQHMAALLSQIPAEDHLLAAQPGRLRVEPYQLVPLMRALEMPRPRLLLADGVGLGKTVQAGLIAAELMARRRAHRIVVIAPSGALLAQWEQELRHRFALCFTRFAHAGDLRDRRSVLESGGNPFTSTALCLLGMDFAKQDHVLEELERATWDLAIIDEAHHCIAAAGPGVDREETQRRRLAEVIARRSDGLLLLTATPHDGQDAHFASLIELLDPRLTDGAGALSGEAYRRHVVRRLKTHIRDPGTGLPLFRERRVTPVRVQMSASSPSDSAGSDHTSVSPGAEAVRRFHNALSDLVRPRLRRGAATDALAFISLLKRSVSTIAACVGTLGVVAERYASLDVARDDNALRRERTRALRAYRRRVLRYGVLDPAADEEAATLEVDLVAGDLHTIEAGDFGRILAELIRLGVAAQPADPKLAALLTEIGLIRGAHEDANILVYTEYADSQQAATALLRAAPALRGEVLAISGSDPEAVRIRAAERFSRENGLILVSTDSLAEGLNLQARCRHLIHLDLPYNPNRLEQRNGRIDRYGQHHEPEIRYLCLAGTFEERLLLRLIAKYEKARACLTLMPDTLGVRPPPGFAEPATGLMAGFAETPPFLFPEPPPRVRTLDTPTDDEDPEALRDLMRDIQRAYTSFERVAVRHGWLGQGEPPNSPNDFVWADAAAEADAAASIRAGFPGRRRDRKEPPDGSHHPAAVESLGTHSSDAASHTGGAFEIDLAAFVGEALLQDAGSGSGHAGALHLPTTWTAGLDGLLGYDAASRIVRVTADPDQWFGPDGRSLAFLSPVHPLVRQALARTDSAGEVNNDRRVGVARAAPGQPPTLCLSYVLEVAEAGWIVRRRVVGVVIAQGDAAREDASPASWLKHTEPVKGMEQRDAWTAVFAPWADARLPEAERLAAAALHRMAAACTARRRQRIARVAAERALWLRRRTDAVCGAAAPDMQDLFGAPPALPRWRQAAAPLDRLGAYAADRSNPADRRRAANCVIGLAQDDERERNAPVTLGLRPAGLLMLVP